MIKLKAIIINCINYSKCNNKTKQNKNITSKSKTNNSHQVTHNEKEKKKGNPIARNNKEKKNESTMKCNNFHFNSFFSNVLFNILYFTNKTKISTKQMTKINLFLHFIYFIYPVNIYFVYQLSYK